MSSDKIDLREMSRREPYRETYQDIEDRRSIAGKDQRRIDKKYNSKRFPNLKRTADYLRKKYLDGNFELDKKEICNDLKISMGTLNIYLCELNRYIKFQPMRWISLSGKKDWIQVAGSDFDNSIGYFKRTTKGITSRITRFTQTREKIQEIQDRKSLEEFEKGESEKIKQEIKNK